MQRVPETKELQVIGVTTIGWVRGKAIHTHRTYPGEPCSPRDVGRILRQHREAFTLSETILRFSNGEEERYVYSRKQI